MSRVFVAEEVALARKVVVKVLPEELSGSVSVARFRREISLAARLQHPHIVPLLTTGDVAGLPYYTMPFVDGESLRARMTHGELPIAEAVSVLRDVAKALAYAHGKNVAHRDIKPDNVLLTGAAAVITDFGVAKALTDAAVGGGLTSVGIALGTPVYMAPEQAAADPATDIRADIYAFGVMAYEMLAGHPPFAGRSMQAIIAAHATEAPQSIVALRAATPAPLAALVMRCLEKRPGDRPQSANELLQALDAVVSAGAVGTSARAASGMASSRSLRVIGVVAGLVVGASALWRMRAASASAGEIRSIAVLPFENTSGDTTFNYLEDGITDHVRDALNAMPTLTVKARSSSRLMKGRAPRDVGGALGVAAVLQGTVSRSASRLHVTAELVRSADDAALWSGTFDGAATELAGMQDSIARAVMGKLHLSVATSGAGTRVNTGSRGTTDIEAYYLFLQSSYALDRNDYVRAADLLHAAVTRDPRYARAHANLGAAYAGIPTLGIGSVDSLNALAKASINTALGLDSTLASAYAAQANVFGNELRLPEVIQQLERAMRYDSSDASILSAYAQALGQVGRVDEALPRARRARELDPLSGLAVGLQSAVFGMARQYAAAIAAVKAGLDLDPKSVIMYQSLGFYYAFNHLPDSAVTAFETAFKLNPTLFGARSNLVFGYAAAGRWADADRQRALMTREKTGNSPNEQQMIVHLAYGEREAAMDALERSVAAREPLIAIMSIPCDPLLDPLKGSPRFASLMRRLGARACPASGTWPIPPRSVRPKGT